MQLFICDFLAGYVGGACGLLIGHPLDTIKTWQQISNTSITKTMLQIIVKNHGLNGFYKGLFFPLLSNGGINSIFFSVYGLQLRYLNSIPGTDSKDPMARKINIFVAGSTAGLVQAVLACPSEVVKVKLQTLVYKAGPIRCVRDIWRSEGYKGFYRGLTPMISRDFLPYGIYMLMYNLMLDYLATLDIVKKQRQILKEKNKSSVSLNNRLEMIVIAVSGAVAGVISWSFVVPFDVVKTTMQSETNPAIYLTTVETTRKVIAEYGWRSLFRGSGMLILRAAPVNAATFLGYELCLRVLQSLFVIEK